MNRWTSFLAVVLGLILSLSCSGSNPAVPDPVLKPAPVLQTADRDSQTNLWGFYDVYVDIGNNTVTANLKRSTMFAANVVQYVNKSVSNLTFKINGTQAGSGFIDVDIDVSIKHPFPGMTQYNGYDVRGVFIGNVSETLTYNSNLRYATHNGTSDQEMYDYALISGDPGKYGNPDGYTRWFNPEEFSKSGLFGYTPGKVATPKYVGTGTLNPYKYFADDLGVGDSLWDFLSTTTLNGVFSAGKINTRNYYLRFPTGTGIKFNYAIVANWKGTEPADHPSNAAEAVGAKVIDESTVYYISPTVKGGNLTFNVSLWDWDSTIGPSGFMEDYTIVVESTVLSGVHTATTSEMTPIGGDENYSTYRFDIPADNISNTENNEYWVIVECADEDYSNILGVPNDASGDPLAAFFRSDLTVMVGGAPPVAVATAEPNPQYECAPVHFDGLDSYDPDGGAIQKYEWDWDNDGTYDEEGAEVDHYWDSPGNYEVQLRVTDNENTTDTLNTPPEITINPATGWAESWGGNDSDTPSATANDSSGNVYIAGYFYSGGNVDFDPDPADEDLHASKGSSDVFLSKFDPAGDFVWAITFGGSDDDRAYTISIDDTGVYVAGFFISSDFDPGNGSPISTLGGWDCWMSKFDFDGDCLWAKTWGGSNHDHVYASAADGSGGIYVGGGFTSSDVDFDPDPGNVENQPSNGTWDSWISKFNSAGEFQWAGVWGWWYDESVNGIAVDPNGEKVYCSGNYGGDVDFDPDPVQADNHISYGWYLDAFMSCFTLSGDYQGVTLWEGDGDERAWRLSVDTSGNIYIAGIASSWIDLDPGTSTVDYYSNGDWDAWLCKLSSTGTFLWGGGWGGGYADMPYGMSSDGSDNVYVTGYFRSPSVDFDPDPAGDDTHNNAGGYNGEADAYLSKFDPSGNLDWAETWGAAAQDIGWGVNNGACDTVFLAGSFSGTVDFQPGGGDPHDSNGGDDVFLMKMFSDGNW